MTTWFVQTFESNQSFSHPDDGTWTTPSIFCEFRAGWRGNPVVCWDRQKVTLPKGADPQNKNWWFAGQQNWDAGPQKQTEQSLFNPRAFCCELFLGGCMEYEWCGRHILVIHSFYCNFLQNQASVGMFVDSWFPDILMSKTDFMNIYSQNYTVVCLNILVSKHAFSMVMCCWISGSRGDESWVETECRYIKRRWNLHRKVEIGIVWTKLVSFVDISSASCFFFPKIYCWWIACHVASNLFPSSLCDQDRLGLGYSASECAFFHKRWHCRSLGGRFAAGFRSIFMDVSLSIDLPPKIWSNLLFICFWQIFFPTKTCLSHSLFSKNLHGLLNIGRVHILFSY